MKKILLHKIEIYQIEDNEDLKIPYSFVATIGELNHFGWTIEDTIVGLLKKITTDKEHEVWALANGWLPPSKNGDNL